MLVSNRDRDVTMAVWSKGYFTWHLTSGNCPPGWRFIWHLDRLVGRTRHRRSVDRVAVWINVIDRRRVFNSRVRNLDRLVGRVGINSTFRHYSL